MAEYSYKTCPVCGINYAIDKIVIDYKYGLPKGHQSGGWFCPNGHSLVFTESALEKARRESERLKQDAARLEDEIRIQRERADKAEKETAKVKKRAHAALCPCCNRHFSQLERHMKSKHPDIAMLPKVAKPK